MGYLVRWVAIALDTEVANRAFLAHRWIEHLRVGRIDSRAIDSYAIGSTMPQDPLGSPSRLRTALPMGALLALALLALALLASTGCGTSTAAPPAPPPPDVVLKTVQPEDVSIYSETVGTLEGMVNAEIRARVPGYIQSQSYADGTFVKAGQLLFTIDPSLTQATAKRARGDLDGARANLAKAELDVTRTRALNQEGLSTTQTLDNALAARALALASVTGAQGTLDTAMANASYSRITAPISGLAGIAKVRVGSLVGQGDATLLTTISQIDPIRVSYTISEQAYLANAKKYQGQVDASAPATLELYLADRSLYAQRGRLSFLDRQIDPTTGTLTAMATFPNPDALLRPGLYAKVRELREVRKGVLLVPQRAVAELQGTFQVIVVGPDNKAETRPVVVGERVDSRWIIDSGLNPGDRVVIEGLQKVRNGMVVAPSAATASPAASASGAPAVR
jgi:membrane fusion protein, multidrug efflux system